jgi:hypothetical protein
MDHRKVLQKIIHKMIPFLIVLVLLITQVSTPLGSFQNACASGTNSSFPFMSSPQFHKCCCDKMDSCCCDVKQESKASWPDMELITVSGEKYDPAPQYVASDFGLQIQIHPQTLKTIESETGIGPPFTSAYLVNLTFRC